MVIVVYCCIAFLLPFVLYFAVRRRTSYTEIAATELAYAMVPIDKDLLRRTHEELAKPPVDESDPASQVTLDDLPGPVREDIIRALTASQVRLEDIAVPGLQDDLVRALSNVKAILNDISDPKMRDDVLRGLIPTSRKKDRKRKKEELFSYRRELRIALGDVSRVYPQMLSNSARARNFAAHDARTIVKGKLEHSPGVFEDIARVLTRERDLRRVVRRIQLRVFMWEMSGFHKRLWGPVPNIRLMRIPDVLDAYEQVKTAVVQLLRKSGQANIAEEIAQSM